MSYRNLLPAVALAMLAAFAGAAWADDAPAPDRSGYTLFNPAPDSALRSLCTDRPTKSTGPCTVDAGRWQVESDIINATFQRNGGVTTDTYLYTNPTVKLGLTNTVDAELTLAPVESVVTHDHGASSTLTGVGDLYARVKWNLIGDDGGAVSIALAPTVKLPTARLGVGNGAVEEGLIAPISVNLPAGWSLTMDPEIDALKDQDGNGRHANYSGLLSFSHAVSKTLTGSAEVWGQVNDDPKGAVHQYSFDLALAWIPAALPNIQVDGGVNFGLNNATPGAQVYFGVSRRF
jgi:hypothetical protein